MGYQITNSTREMLLIPKKENDPVIENPLLKNQKQIMFMKIIEFLETNGFFSSNVNTEKYIKLNFM